jgi:hypothetical protein
VVFSASPALTGTPTAPTAAAATNTTQIATTAHVFAERTNTATLTNKTLTDPTINGGTANPATLQENSSPVVTQTDVGTAPNQLPLNQYLGSMAYLDADNIAFSATGANAAAQNLAVNKLTTVTISADTTLTTTVPLVGSTAYVIVITSGATTRTVTFGTGFKSTGTLATGTDADRRFVFQFISDGTNLVEVSRTAAITY